MGNKVSQNWKMTAGKEKGKPAAAAAAVAPSSCALEWGICSVDCSS